jgi:DNA-binding NtrC family response regulator
MERTVPRQRTAIAVRAIAARVVDGPDRGASARADEDALTIGTAEGCALRLRDPTVSRHHVELSPDAGGIRARDLGSTNGVRFGSLRIVDAVVPSGASIAIGASTIRVEDAGVVDTEAGPVVDGLVGESPSARTLARRIDRAARSGAPVLVEGESGTGKELVAAAIHARSTRAHGPFVVVDAGALAPTLVASELFGHAKGAFTGAREARAGAFERASGGTLFLDEVGELPASVQPLLLGAFARGRIRRVGADDEIAIDVRLVCATHRDLRSAVNEGTFRADLYHRIAVVRIAMPPLRERAEDVPLLVEHFLRAEGFTGERREIVPDDVLDRLCAHPWPGNVRELRNAVETALAMREPPELDPVPPCGPFAEVKGRPWREARDEATSAFERRYLEALLETSRQNVAEAARVAGLDRTHLHDLLKRNGLR